MDPYKIIEFISEKVPKYTFEFFAENSPTLLPIPGKGYIDENGLEQGLFISKFEKGSFKDGKYHGYWENRGVLNGQHKFLEKLNFVDGKLEGKQIGYVEDKIWFIKSYKNEFLDGYYEEHDNNGNLEQKGYMKDGIMVGYWETYHPNGQLRSRGRYKNGKKDGLWVEFYDNGKLMTSTEYKDDIKNGYFEYRGPSGKIFVSTKYKDGFRED